MRAMANATPRLWKKLRFAMIERGSPRHLETEHIWAKEPSFGPGDEVCLFVAFAPSGRFSEHSLVHARAWAEAGLRVVLVVVTNERDHFHRLADAIPPWTDGALLRLNEGHDFGAWATAITSLKPRLQEASLLVTVNDSLFGPMGQLSPLIERVRQADADLVGAVESHEGVRHFQSFMLFFKAKALPHRLFWRFWENVRNVPKWLVITTYEQSLCSAMERAGLRTAALFPKGEDDWPNPSLHTWRSLLQRGFPFVKVTAVRVDCGGEPKAGWEDVFRNYGYDPGIAHRHLAGHTIG